MLASKMLELTNEVTILMFSQQPDITATKGKGNGRCVFIAGVTSYSHFERPRLDVEQIV